MDPQQGTVSRRLPLREYIALNKPSGGSRVVGSRGNVMILPRIRGTKPSPDFLLQRLTYHISWLNWRFYMEVTTLN
jgi:hypothetical protein